MSLSKACPFLFILFVTSKALSQPTYEVPTFHQNRYFIAYSWSEDKWSSETNIAEVARIRANRICQSWGLTGVVTYNVVSNKKIKYNEMWIAHGKQLVSAEFLPQYPTGVDQDIDLSLGRAFVTFGVGRQGKKNPRNHIFSRIVCY